MIAAILAKRSERFPGKHMHEFRGTTLIGYLVDKLQSSGLFSEVIIFTRDPGVHHGNATVLPDNTGGTAINSVIYLVRQFGEVFVLAGDMPLVDTGLIAEMLERYRDMPLFPVHGDGWIEPLHGIYNSSMLVNAEKYLETGEKSLIGLIRLCSHEVMPIDQSKEQAFTNINRKEDLDRIKRQDTE